jgi:hypothetical protein
MSSVPVELEQLLAGQQAVKEAKVAAGREEAVAKQPASTASRPLKGGMAASKGVTAAKVDPEQLRLGVEVEKEHTADAATAQRIALDHLAEIPDYYTRLQTMEAAAKKEQGAVQKSTVEKTATSEGKKTMKLTQLVELLKTAATCPGGKLRSKGKGRGLGHGKGKGPIGVPFGAKKSEDQLVQALQQVKLAQALKEAQLSPEQAEILKQVLPDLVTPGSTGWGGLKGTLGGGALGALLGIPLGPSGVAGGAGLGAGIGGLGGAVAGGLRGRKKARKAVEHASGESEEKPKKKEKEDVKESQAFMIGFLAKCAEAGCTAQELEKIAVNWQAILAGLKQSPQGLLDLVRGRGAAGVSGTGLEDVGRTVGKGTLSGGAPGAADERTQSIAKLMGMLGLGGGAVAAPAALAGGIAGRAAAPEPPDTMGEKLRALMQQ